MATAPRVFILQRLQPLGLRYLHTPDFAFHLEMLASRRGRHHEWEGPPRPPPHHRKVTSKEESIMAHHSLPRPAAVYGIDIGKNLFHVVGLSCDGTPVQKIRFRRETLLQFFARAQPSIVGTESCAGSQWLARKIKALGHKVRLIPAQFVKPYVKSNKTISSTPRRSLRPRRDRQCASSP